MIIAALALITSAPTAQERHLVEPAIQCEVRMPSWCILRLAIRFSVADQGDVRIWTVTSPLQTNTPITIRENRACSADFSDGQRTRTILPSEDSSAVGADLIQWRLSREGDDWDCTLLIRIPYRNGHRDEAAYEMAVTTLAACTAAYCSGPTLHETLTAPPRSRR